MIKKLNLVFVLLLVIFSASAKEYHVAKTGSDNNSGTIEQALLTIQAAADRAQAGDIITDFLAEGFKLEVGHGPIIVDNNLSRIVPYYELHSTKEAGRAITLNNYDQYHNNIFIGNGHGKP